MKLKKTARLKIDDIFFLSDNSTVLSVEDNLNIELNDFELFKIMLNGKLFKPIKIDGELILKKRIRKNYRALETRNDLNGLKDIDFNLDELLLILE